MGISPYFPVTNEVTRGIFGPPNNTWERHIPHLDLHSVMLPEERETTSQVDKTHEVLAQYLKVI